MEYKEFRAALLGLLCVLCWSFFGVFYGVGFEEGIRK